MIVVSNRGPFRFSQNDDGSFAAHRGSGGIVSTLMPLLADHEGTTWVAAAIGADDYAAAVAGAPSPPGPVKAHMLALDPVVAHQHYDLISNGVLWFLYHGMLDVAHEPSFGREFRTAWEGYVSVNHSFANAVLSQAKPNEVVLVQDYQLALVPKMLSDVRPDLRVVHFTHTPFCGPDAIRILPEYVAHALCASMATCPAGFHTQRWAQAYRASVRELLGPDVVAPTFVAPIGPDAATLHAESTSHEVETAIASLRTRVGDCQLIVRSDRMDLSKNIVRGFQAYDLLLAEHPELRNHVVFAALLNPSRESLPVYRTYHAAVERAAALVNERWGTPTWSPVLLDIHDDYPRSLAGLACSDVLLVNPVRDGLNLVALEGPLVNRHDGVLCLSREAGAHEKMSSDCLTVQPCDLVQTAAVLHEALTMVPSERRARALGLRAHAAADTPASWLATQLAQVPTLV